MGSNPAGGASQIKAFFVLYLRCERVLTTSLTTTRCLSNDSEDYRLRFIRGSSGQELDNVVEGLVGFAVGSFDFGQWRGSLSGASLEEAVGQRTADALMEEHK